MTKVDDMSDMHTAATPTARPNDSFSRPRIHGYITGIHPPTFDEKGHPTGGGYIWIMDGDESYFGHITQFQVGKSIYDLRVGQRCTFVVGHRKQGQTAELIEF